MVSEKIHVRVYGPGSDITGPTTVECIIKENQTVEDFIFEVLDRFDVGPIYRYLFGLRVIEKEIWLAPNLIIADEFQAIKHLAVDKVDEDQISSKDLGIKLIKQVTKKTEPPNQPTDDQLTFQIQLKFKPASMATFRELDRAALEMIWCEIRYLVLNKNYIHEVDQRFLADCKLLELVVLDVTRYVIENNITPERFHTGIKFKKFIPKYNYSWTKRVDFSHDDVAVLLRSVKFALDASSNMGEFKSRNLKAMYIEKYLYEVCSDHGVELYRANEITVTDLDRIVTVKISKDNKVDRFCKVEKVPFQVGTKGFTGDWEDVCSIDTVLSASCEGSTIFIDRPDLQRISLEFHHHLNALSFLSLIHGYGRLSRQWNLNITRGVHSPLSKSLMINQIHGPIDVKLVERKFSQKRKGGSYLIRHCNLRRHHYIIDILIERSNYCSICVRHDKESGKFFKEDHEFWPKRLNYELTTTEESYDNLENILHDINISLPHGMNVQALVRLRPTEHDDCLNLLLCLDAKAMHLKLNPVDKKSPVMISPDELSLTRDSLQMSGNRLCVKTGIRTRDRRPIIYKFADLLIRRDERYYQVYDHYNRVQDKDAMNNDKNEINQEAILIAATFNSDYMTSNYFIQVEQNRIMDWAYLNHPNLAETLGIELSRCALIQEGFADKLRFDIYLRSLNGVMPSTMIEGVPIQIAEAVEYLETARVVHGKIRCHNIYVKRLDPFWLCITDPLGVINFHRDRAFIPSEINLAHQFNEESINEASNGKNCIGINGIVLREAQQIHITKLTPGFDMWGVATTVWQVYNFAKRPPPGQYAYHLQKPRICSNRLWCCLQDCWHPNPNSRPSAIAFVRHVRRIFADVRMLALTGQRDHESISDESRLYSPAHHKLGYTQIDNHSAGGTSNNGTNSVATTTTGLNDTSHTNGSLSSNSDDNREQSTTNGHCQEGANMNESYYQVDDEISYIIDSTNLLLQNEIGRGSCGVVRRAKLRRPQQESVIVAVKYVINPSSEYYRDELADLRKEYAILKGLNHENIVRIYGITNEDHVKLVFEYLPLGSLLNFLRNSVNSYTNLPLNKYARDIANGLSYLESKDIVHRDLALRNVLMKSSMEVKLCDFGLAKKLKSEEEYTIANLNKGLPWKWCAPETYTRWIFTHKTDVWSFGVVLWELHTGGQNPQYPGTIRMIPELFEKGIRLQKPHTCPQDIYNLMQECWAYNPDDRPSFKSICEDPSIKEDYIRQNA